MSEESASVVLESSNEEIEGTEFERASLQQQQQ